MARLRYNGLTATLGGSGLTSSATSVTFGAALTHAAGSVPTIASPDYLPLTILDSSGNVSEIVSLTAYTSGAATGTITRAQEGTTGVAHSSGDKVVHGPTVLDVQSGGLLAAVSYNPSTQVTVSATSTTPVDMDVTNLSVTFAAPPSGAVLIRLSAMAKLFAGVGMVWGVRESGSLITERYMGGYITSGSYDIPAAVPLVVTGLTPSATHTYTWSLRRDGTSNTPTTQFGGVVGPAVMELHAL